MRPVCKLPDGLRVRSSLPPDRALSHVWGSTSPARTRPDSAQAYAERPARLLSDASLGVMRWSKFCGLPQEHSGVASYVAVGRELRRRLQWPVAFQVFNMGGFTVEIEGERHNAVV